MNKNINQRFAITAEIVFTTHQEMDDFDAEQSFEAEISEYWDGYRDLDFESVLTKEVKELPADECEYEDYKREKRSPRLT